MGRNHEYDKNLSFAANTTNCVKRARIVRLHRAASCGIKCFWVPFKILSMRTPFREFNYGCLVVFGVKSIIIM